MKPSDALHRRVTFSGCYGSDSDSDFGSGSDSDFGSGSGFGSCFGCS